jgi:chromosome segregation ATPase
MDFLKKVGSTAESLLEQVDQKTAEISKDVRSGNRAARQVAERLEKRERIVIGEGSVIGPDISKQIERMQADLDAAGEVLTRSQQIAAERENKLNAQLANERSEREKREEELITRIKQLESGESRCVELEKEVEELSQALEEARGSRDQDTVELQAQAEAARADAEQARAALAAAIKDSGLRTAELERTNLELVKQLSELKSSKDSTSTWGTTTSSALEDERRQRTKETQDLEDRLIAVEDKRSSLQMQLTAERIRAERLENELNRLTASQTEVRDTHTKQLVALETKIATMKKEADEAKSVAESFQRANQSNGRDALEKRLESLSSHLELKQRQIDVLRSEKAALEQRLNDTSIFQGLRARPSVVGGSDGKLKLAKLRIDADKHRQLARAVDVMDGLTLSAAAVLRSQPLVRLGFLAYVLLLHFWVFHVIAWTSTPSSTAQGSLLRGSSTVGGATSSMG